MRHLVIYDSIYGNTQKIAEEIATSIKGKAVYVQDFKNETLNDVTLLVVGSPTHGGRPTPCD